MKNHIIDLIKLSQLRDSNSLVELIELFDPLLKKYAKKLNYDDAYYDLRFEFIKTIYKLNTTNLENLSEGQIVIYVSKIIYHHYINYSKKTRSHKNTILFSDMSDSMISFIDARLLVEDQKKNYDIEYALRKLNIDDQILINLIFYNDYSIREIAQTYGTSRQAINQEKKRIIQKLNRIMNERAKETKYVHDQ
jgi:RNA polymerase sigma factor (sigma-70 family)